MDETVKGFFIGITIGTVIGGYFGYKYGVKVKGKSLSHPEFRIIIAAVVVCIWAVSHILALLFSTEVDAWLNTIMGMIVGFFFGDGLVETYRDGGKDKG